MPVSTAAEEAASAGEHVRGIVLPTIPRTPSTSPRKLDIVSGEAKALETPRGLPEVAVMGDMLKVHSAALMEYMVDLMSQQEQVIARLLEKHVSSCVRSQERTNHSETQQKHDTAVDGEGVGGGGVGGAGGGDFPFRSESSQSTPRSMKLRKQTSLQKQLSLRIELHPVWCPEDDRLSEVLASITRPASQRRKRTTTVSLTPFVSQPSRSSSGLLSTEQQLESVRFPLHPESKTRMTWDFLGVCCICYDAVTVPLQVFDFDAIAAMAWVTTIFWTVDILVSSCTGVYVKGELVMQLPKIILNYFKTWLCFDICLVVSEWIFLAQDHMDSFEALIKSSRGLRSLRLIRLLRLAKLAKMAQRMQNLVKSVYVLLVLNIVSHLVVILFCNHVIASLWYLMGNSSDLGWVVRTDVRAMDLSYKYLTSLHWSISQFHGPFDIEVETTRERAFAVTVLLVGLIAFSIFISSVTQSMFDLQRRSKEKNTERRLLHKYLQEHKISIALTARAKHFMEYTAENEEKQRESQSNVGALAKLPKDMLMDIHAEARSSLLASRIIFSDLSERVPEVIRLICHDSMSELAYSSNQHVFAIGDLVGETTIIEQGCLLYCPQATDDEFEECCPQKNSWVCEASLWMNWMSCGRLTSKTYASCVRIASEAFAETMCKNEVAYVMSCMYAKKFCQAVHQGLHSDIVDYGVHFYMTPDE